MCCPEIVVNQALYFHSQMYIGLSGVIYRVMSKKKEKNIKKKIGAQKAAAVKREYAV